MTHSQLIARLEQLTGPDREVDLDLWIHLFKGKPFDTIMPQLAFTASVDAALALAAKVLPREWPSILSDAGKAISWKYNWHMNFPKPEQLEELPRQICIAILKAHGASK